MIQENERYTIRNSFGYYLERGTPPTDIWVKEKEKALDLSFDRAFDLVITLNFVYKEKILFIIESK